MTKPFEKEVTIDGINLNQLRLGERVPPGAVNLAYVYSNPLNPEENIQIINLNNSAREEASELLRVDGDGYLTREDSNIYFKSDKFYLTNEFASGNYTDPLYFKYVISDYHLDRSGLTTGSSFAISISSSDGVQLDGSAKYKVVCVEEIPLLQKIRSGTAPTGKSAYRLSLYLNFNSDKTYTYVVKYNKVKFDNDNVITTLNSNYSENINAIPIMLSDDITIDEDSLYYPPSTYTVEHNPDGYTIKVPDLGVTDPRPKNPFCWKLKVNDGRGTQWVYDYLIDEYGDNKKRLSPLSINEILGMYRIDSYTSFKIVGGICQDNGSITNLADGDSEIIINNDIKISVIDGYLYATQLSQVNVPEFDELSANNYPVQGTIKAVAKVHKTWEDFKSSITLVYERTTIPDNSIKWRVHDSKTNITTYWTDDTSTLVNIDAFSGYAGKTIIFETNIWVPEDITISTGICYDDVVEMRVNFKQIIYSTSWSRDEYVPISFNLKAGWNYIIIGVGNKTGKFFLGFSSSISSLVSSALNGATYYMHPNGGTTVQQVANIQSGTCTVELDNNNDPIIGTFHVTYTKPMNNATNPKIASIIPNNDRIQIIKNYNISTQYDTLTQETISTITFMAKIKSSEPPLEQKSSEIMINTPSLEQKSSEIMINTRGVLNTTTMLEPKIICNFQDLYNKIANSMGSLTEKEQENLIIFIECVSNNSPTRKISLALRNNGTFYVDEKNPINGYNDANGSLCFYDIKDYTGYELVAWTTYSNLSTSDVYSYKNKIPDDIHIRKPEPLNTSLDNWYISLFNSSLVKNITIPRRADNEKLYDNMAKIYPEIANYQGSDATLVYSMPEFNNNNVISDVVGENSNIIDSYSIKVNRTPICIFKPINVSIDGNIYTIKDIQAEQGIITFNNSIPIGAKISSNYSYWEEWVQYRGFYDGNNFWHLDLNPAPHHDMTTLSTGIPGHLSSSYVTEEASQSATSLYLSKPIYIYLLPYSVRVESGELLNNKNNINDQSVSDITIYHTTDKSIIEENLFVLPIGKIYIQPNSSLRNMIIIDTRSRGGGLEEFVTQAIIEQRGQDANSYFDIGRWDGRAFQENGVALIHLPESVRVKFGEEKVLEIVKKHIALGVLPQIEYISDSEFISEFVKKIDNVGNISYIIDNDDVILEWSDIIAEEYCVIRNGVEIATVITNSYTDNNTVAGEEYTYEVYGKINSKYGTLVGDSSTITIQR